MNTYTVKDNSGNVVYTGTDAEAAFMALITGGGVALMVTKDAKPSISVDVHIIAEGF